MRWLPFLLLFCLVPLRASAKLTKAQCIDKDLSSQMGPIRNQRGSEWCWAMADSDLIGFEAKLKPGENVSALDLAVKTFATSPREQTDYIDQLTNGKDTTNLKHNARVNALHRVGGITREVELSLAPLIAYQRAGGICLESQLSTRADSDDDETDFVKQQVRKYKELADDADGRTPGLLQKCRDAALALLHLSTATTRHAMKEISSVIDKKECKNRLPWKDRSAPVSIPVGEQGQPDASDIAAKALLAGKPAGIQYNADFLDEGILRRSPQDHNGVIVGMHWNGTSCDFKMRNSWGTDDSIYADGVRERSKGGVILVHESELNTTTSSVYGFLPH